MKRIKIGFTDTFDGTADFFLDKFKEIVGFEFVRDDSDPAILIFGDENFGTNNLQYDPKKVIKIFYTGENRRWYNYQAHFGITFDHIDDDRHFRLPLYFLNMHYLAKRHGLIWEDEHARRKREYARRSPDFCGYVQSNPNCEKRNQFFDRLNSYKKVNAAGPHKNNTGYILPRGEDGIIKKFDFLRKHKFSLAFENGSYAGYATEKLLEAYMAGTVPIYWGSPTVSLDFNPECFINWHNYKDDDEFMWVIENFDKKTDLYDMIYRQPLFKPVQNSPEHGFNRWFEKNILRHF